jgi:CheY-like chemotaxis protein
MGEREPVNILLVDDDPGKLLSYEAILSDLGEHLITARSGREALQRLLDHEIAVILLDVQMPDMDGFALARLIREHPRYQDLPMIFISAVLLTPRDQLRAYDHGAVDYLTVPFLPELLRAKVRVFVEHYRCRRELAHAQRDAQRAQHFAMLGRLAAGVSHEIRNPLAALTLHIDLLDEELHDRAPESAAMVAELLTEIKTQLARVDDLLQDYLSLVRVAAIERPPEDLGEALQAWAGEWQQLAQSQGVTLRLEGIAHLARSRCIPAHSAVRSSISCRMRSTLCHRGVSSPCAGSVPRPTCSFRCRILAAVSRPNALPRFLSRCIPRSLAGQG